MQNFFGVTKETENEANPNKKRNFINSHKKIPHSGFNERNLNERLG